MPVLEELYVLYHMPHSLLKPAIAQWYKKSEEIYTQILKTAVLYAWQFHTGAFWFFWSFYMSVF